MEALIVRRSHPFVLWTARCVVATVAASALVLSIGFNLRNEHTWWLELARYAPYPGYLLSALVAVGLSFLLGRWWRLAALAALGLVVTVIMGLVVGRSDTGSGRLRVMTYNIKSYTFAARASGYSRIAWEVVRHDPDILLVQDGGVISGPVEEMPVAVRTMLRGREVYSHGQYMVASRYPLRDCKPGQIPYRGKEHSYVRCTVEVSGTEIDLVTAHFVSPRDGLNATRHERLDGLDEWRQNFTDRMTQANLLVRDLAGSARPMIVGGDLNAAESSPVVGALLATGLRDAFSIAGVGYGFTHGHTLKLGFSFLRIDHILVSPTLGVRDCFVGGSEGSEHRPVIADLLLTRG